MTGTETMSRAEEAASAVRTVRPEVLVVLSVLLAAVGQLALKYALLHAGPSLPVYRIALGLGIYGLGTLLWIVAVSRADISYLYPLSAINYSLVALGGSLLFGEPVRWDRWLGIAVITAGVALLTRTSTARTAEREVQS